jgi:hypothetical protein
MLGDATAEFAERIRDEVRLYRFGNQLKLLKKAEKMAQDAGFTPRAVPAKLLFPLLDGASLEEDDDLHTMWAALLANASSPDNAEKVRPGFIAALRQMAPDEAVTLRWMHERTWAPDGDSTFTERTLGAAYYELGLAARGTSEPEDVRDILKPSMQLGSCMDGLEAARLVRSEDNYEQRVYKLTTRGDQLISMCRPPRPRRNG